MFAWLAGMPWGYFSPAFEAVSGEAALSGNNLTRPKFDEHSLIFDKRRLIFRNSADCFTVKIHPV
jgi:hypothetical protein